MQSVPLAVLKRIIGILANVGCGYCMQSVPLAVLKRVISTLSKLFVVVLHAIRTACGIETHNSHQFLSDQECCPLHAIRTACGIETQIRLASANTCCDCMQSVPLAVLKRPSAHAFTARFGILHAIRTACGIETRFPFWFQSSFSYCMQSVPLAVLKRGLQDRCADGFGYCMQSVPLAVLKLSITTDRLFSR